MSTNSTIPYNTWGGVSTYSTVPTQVENPYTINNLQFNCKVNSSINIDNRIVVTNMANYAQLNIPNYNTITSIPEEYSPNSINTSTAQNWHYAFDYCNNLTSLPDPFFDTINATDMGLMFGHCYNIITVPNFDTSNVTSMSRMFFYCRNLTTIPNFDTSNVTTMYHMFHQCNLTTVPNFDTSNVTDMEHMFSYCDNLTTVPNFDTSNVTSMGSMFERCYNLTTVPNFDTSNAIDMSQMLSGCTGLTTIPIFNINSATNIGIIFYGCNIIRGNFYISSNNVVNARSLFTSGNHIKNIYCHANSTTYNTIYAAMGNNTYNSSWNAYLKTMENDYAEISWTGNGIYKFPTNKIQLMYTDNSQINTIEILPYTDYQLNSVIDKDNPIVTYAPDISSYIEHNGTKWGEFTGSIKFRFFKDITNMTPDIADPGITIQGLQDPNSEIYVNNKKYNSNPFYCEFEGEQLLEIYSPNYLSISQEINIPKNTSITVDVEQNRNDAIKVTIIPSVSGANITYKYGTMTNYGTTNDDGTFYVPKNTDIEYIVKLIGYKTVTNIINISEDTVINITLEKATYEDINIFTPFTDNTEYLTNLVDDSNFEISGDYIQSGSSSYHKNNGTSYGYIQFTTPGEVYIDSPIEIECYVSSESSCDYAAVYIGTQVYEPSRTQIRNETTDGNGEFIFTSSGNGSLSTYTYNNLLPNTTYYLSFAYTKDGSVNRNDDRFFIKSIKFRIFG